MAEFGITGRVIRKKNVSKEFLTLTILPHKQEKSTTVFVRRQITSDQTDNVFDPEILFRSAILKVKGNILLNEDGKCDRNNPKQYIADEIFLIQCAPDPTMVALFLPKVLSQKIYSPSIFLATEEELLHINNLNGRSRRLALNKIISRLEGKEEQEGDCRKARRRPPHMKRAHLANLERIEKSGLWFSSSSCSDNSLNDTDKGKWKLCQPCDSDIPNEVIEQQQEKSKQFFLNVPLNTENKISTHGFLTRGQYIEGKKMKQVAWFISRLKMSSKCPRHILDVGGGRGDLAVQLAVEYDECLVTVVDKNESSLLAGREYARKFGVSERMTFRHEDFRDFVTKYEKSDESTPIDHVVALHACGDLSDLALDFANRNGCDFLVCPCCYTKQYLKPFIPSWYNLCNNDTELDTLKRLAELNERPDISRRAYNVINSMRVVSLQRHTVSIEEYDPSSSKRNIVLVGEVQ